MSRLVEEFLDERNAPPAARTGAITLADLTGSSRSVDANEVADLSLGNVKAVTEFVVRLHVESLT